MMITEWVKRFRDYMESRRKLKVSIRTMLATPEWMDAETEIRKGITALYKSLGNCRTEKDLHRVQAALTARVEFFQELYLLADLEWGWQGFKDIGLADIEADDDLIKAEYENLLQKRAMNAAQS